MKVVTGYIVLSFSNDGTNRQIASIYYSDDDVSPEFVGCSTGYINIPVGLCKGFENISVGSIIDIVPKLSKRGKVYKTVEILG